MLSAEAAYFYSLKILFEKGLISYEDCFKSSFF